jgi:hypothetical protein
LIAPQGEKYDDMIDLGRETGIFTDNNRDRAGCAADEVTAAEQKRFLVRSAKALEVPDSVGGPRQDSNLQPDCYERRDIGRYPFVSPLARSFLGRNWCG